MEEAFSITMSMYVAGGACLLFLVTVITIVIITCNKRKTRVRKISKAPCNSFELNDGYSGQGSRKEWDAHSEFQSSRTTRVNPLQSQSMSNIRSHSAHFSNSVMSLHSQKDANLFTGIENQAFVPEDEYDKLMSPLEMAAFEEDNQTQVLTSNEAYQALGDVIDEQQFQNSSFNEPGAQSQQRFPHTGTTQSRPMIPAIHPVSVLSTDEPLIAHSAQGPLPPNASAPTCNVSPMGDVHQDTTVRASDIASQSQASPEHSGFIEEEPGLYCTIGSSTEVADAHASVQFRKADLPVQNPVPQSNEAELADNKSPPQSSGAKAAVKKANPRRRQLDGLISKFQQQPEACARYTHPTTSPIQRRGFDLQNVEKASLTPTSLRPPMPRPASSVPGEDNTQPPDLQALVDQQHELELGKKKLRPLYDTSSPYEWI